VPRIARVGAAFAFLLLATTSGPAQFGDDSDGFYDPPLSYSETLQGVVRSGRSQPPGGPLGRLRDLFPAIGACWSPPAGLSRLEILEVTVRFSLRRDGSLFGAPRVTFATPAAETRARDILRTTTVEAIRACTPLKITPALGGAITGRPIAVRFIYQGPKGRGA
jgi:hypothetical protein